MYCKSKFIYKNITLENICITTSSGCPISLKQNLQKEQLDLALFAAKNLQKIRGSFIFLCCGDP